MAQVKSVKLRSGFTINMGNYESAKFETEVELTLDEGETVEDALKQAEAINDAETGKQLKSLKRLKSVKDNQNGYILDVVKLEDTL